MKNLYYDMIEYIEENYRLKQNKSINNYDITLDLNGSFEIISKENNNNEKLKASLGSNVSNRTTYKNP